MILPRTLSDLKSSPWAEQPLRGRTVRDEIRTNLLARLAAGGPLFPGIVGYEETVMPQIVNALLARHNFILLGLRGQAKSRHPAGADRAARRAIPIVAGSEVNDNPFAPISKYARELLAECGDGDADRVGRPRPALRREARDARRHDRRHHRRRRPDQGRARRAHALRRADDPLRHAAAREPRHLRAQRAARPRAARCRSACSTSCRKATSRSKAIRCGCRSTCCCPSPPIPRTTPRAARSSRRSRTASGARSSRTIRGPSSWAWRSRRRRRGPAAAGSRSTCPTSCSR